MKIVVLDGYALNPGDLSWDALARLGEVRQREFFRLWTRLEARWKALGVGLRGAGREIEGPWTVQDLTLDDAVAAAVAAPSPDMRVFLHAFGDDQ